PETPVTRPIPTHCWPRPVLATLMALLALATVLGNALVVVAFAVDRSLRSRSNFFFLNLAVADLLVGGFCIPLYIPYILTGEWKFGKGLCKLWLVTDYLVCTASVFNIVLISYDRFISVTRAVTYRAQKSMTRNAIFKMALVWVAAFLLYGPAIISWEYVAKRSILPRGECYAEFFYNWYFLMTASIIEFFTPFVSVTYFNLSIYINIQKRNSLRNDYTVPSQDGLEMNFQGRKKKHASPSNLARPCLKKKKKKRWLMLAEDVAQGWSTCPAYARPPGFKPIVPEIKIKNTNFLYLHSTERKSSKSYKSF
uniref:G-protein coupled receptors family 1 profile domain-containing protein n=1 Tax=Spermophilus dauricus TaxID=99837 RepID=A0A8C9NX79_SPEDA